MLESPGPVIYDLGQRLALPAGVLVLRWYGLLTVSGFLLALLIIYRRSREFFAPEHQHLLFDWAIVTFLGGILGARLWFVILNGNDYLRDPWMALAIWQGGQSIQGGFLGGTIASLFFYHWRKEQLPSWLCMADQAAIALPVAQAIGRWGNFFNVEAFGPPSHVPWCLQVPLAKRPSEHLAESCFHPTFAYESLYLLLAALGLYLLARRFPSLPSGLLFCAYLGLYSVGRFFLEFFRLDSLLIGPFPAAQVVCVFTLLLSVGAAGYLLRRSRN